MKAKKKQLQKIIDYYWILEDSLNATVESRGENHTESIKTKEKVHLLRDVLSLLGIDATKTSPTWVK
jgi:hypothetical protein